MEKLDSALREWIVLYFHYFNFFILMHFTNQITVQQSLAEKLSLIFKNGKTFTGCYTIALKLRDEFNDNFFCYIF